MERVLAASATDRTEGAPMKPTVWIIRSSVKQQNKQILQRYLESLKVKKKHAYFKRKLKSERNDANPEMTQNMELANRNVKAHIIYSML